MAVCGVCFRHCELSEGQIGFCGARICAGGTVRAANYGRITSLALDPIEKKPLFCRRAATAAICAVLSVRITRSPGHRKLCVTQTGRSW